MQKYKIEFGKTYNIDQAGNHTKSVIYITDNATGKIHHRMGDGRQIGNFHPIWINWQGKKIQLERLADEELK